MDAESVDCYNQLDSLNSAFTKAVSSYGIDSVMFYKVVGDLFSAQFDVHTYPTFVYVDPEAILTKIDDDDFGKLNLKRIAGPIVTENNVATLVMNCVEDTYAQANADSLQRWAQRLQAMDDSFFDASVLLNDLRTSFDYIGQLEEAVGFLQQQGPSNFAFESIVDEDALALQVLLEQ